MYNNKVSACTLQENLTHKGCTAPLNLRQPRTEQQPSPLREGQTSKGSRRVQLGIPLRARRLPPIKEVMLFYYLVSRQSRKQEQLGIERIMRLRRNSREAGPNLPAKTLQSLFLDGAHGFVRQERCPNGCSAPTDHLLQPTRAEARRHSRIYAGV